MSRPRVALDARPLQSEPLGGVGRYLAEVIPHLAEHVDIYLLLDGRRPVTATTVSGDLERVRLSAPPRVPGLGWLELAVAPWLRRFDGVFHATFNMAPLTFRGRSVLTLYDLAPQLHAEDFRPLTRAAWRLYIRRSAARAGAITTISEFVKGQIVDYFRVDPSRIRVAPVPLDPVFDAGRSAQAGALAERLGITPPYVVAVGGAPRRGLDVAIEAWRRSTRLLGRDVTLVVVRNAQLPPEPGIVAPGYLDDEAWATLLAGAQALCYPTRYEGFGLPALEGAASGTPVVCAPLASLPEVMGDSACWASAPTPEAMAEVLTRVLSDPEFHHDHRAAGLARAASAPSSYEVAQILLAAYEQAAP